MSRNKIQQSELFLKELFDKLEALHIPEHGRGVLLEKASGYSSGHISDILNRKKLCTDKFYKIAMAGLSQSECIAEPGEKYGVTEIIQGTTPEENAMLQTLRRSPEARTILKLLGEMDEDACRDIKSIVQKEKLLWNLLKSRETYDLTPNKT